MRFAIPMVQYKCLDPMLLPINHKLSHYESMVGYFPQQARPELDAFKCRAVKDEDLFFLIIRCRSLKIHDVRSMGQVPSKHSSQ